MDEKKMEAAAMFRFGVISSLIGLRKTEHGERERRIREITRAEWDIPYSRRSYISRSAILEWIKRYEDSGRKLESLYPKERNDKDMSKSMDKETQGAIIGLKGEFPRASLPVLLSIAKDRKILPPDFKASIASVYRFMKRHGAFDEENREDRRKFEAEIPNDLWQADCMYGPYVIEGGKKKKRRTFLLAILDDHSRLIVHAQFYMNDSVENFIDCFERALRKRGLPRKLYVDNGPVFRSHHLKSVTAYLGIAFIHARPYVPQGKGKIERWFRTIRIQLLSCLPETLSLDELNTRLFEWIDKEYHVRVHTGTNERPLERYLRQLHLIRAIPDNLMDYFRLSVIRKVRYNRTVSLNGKLFEAPIGLVGKAVSLRLHAKEPGKIEVFYQKMSYGFLTPVNPNINYRVGRIKPPTDGVSDGDKRLNEDADNSPDMEDQRPYRGGSLFDKKEEEGNG